MRQFFVSIKNLQLNEFHSEIIELMPRLNITNSKTIKARLLSEKTRNIIGIIESQYFENNDTYFYYEFENNEPLFKDLNNLEILNSILLWIDDILRNL